jgi:hypothetical protein
MGDKNNLSKDSSFTQTVHTKNQAQPLFNAWISPNGKIYEVDVGYHSNFVIAFIEEKYGTDYLLKMKHFSTRQMYEYMEERGWIRVTNWRSGEFHFIFPKKIRIPRNQVKAVVDICIDHNISMPQEIL